MSEPNDTSPEATQVLLQVYRAMSPGRKWLLLGEMYQDARVLHAVGVRLRNPAATPREIRADWLRVQLGFMGETTMSEPPPDQSVQNLRDLREVLGVFTRLDIPYALGGSMASSVHGVSRHTRDADITVEPFPGKEAALAAGFGPDYYVSEAALRDALRRRSSFNIINTTTGFKVDVFARHDAGFEESAMRRRIAVEFPDAPGKPLFLHTAEDVILFKLRWYRLGNESARQQWTDVLGVLQVQAGRLDQAYLDHWAADLGVTDLLRRARQEAG
jgi:hypothetical protein